MSSEADHPPAVPERAEASSPTRLVESLTPRQREVLALIGKGFSTAEIARQLYRTVKTIESHRLVLGKRLGARNRVELARIAIGAGLVDLSHTTAPQHDALDGLQILERVHRACNDAPPPARLDAIARELAAAINARVCAIFRLGTDDAMSPVAAAGTDDDISPSSYFSLDAPDHAMHAGEIRSIDMTPAFLGVPETPENADLVTTFVALHDARARRLGTLAVVAADGHDDADESWRRLLRLVAARIGTELEHRECDARFARLEALLARVWGGGIAVWEHDLREGSVSRPAHDHSTPEHRKDPMSRVHPDDRARVASACDDAVDSMTRTSIECRVLARDGSERRALVCCEPAPDSTGRPRWVLGAIRELPDSEG